MFREREKGTRNYACKRERNVVESRKKVASFLCKWPSRCYRRFRFTPASNTAPPCLRPPVAPKFLKHGDGCWRTLPEFFIYWIFTVQPLGYTLLNLLWTGLRWVVIHKRCFDRWSRGGISTIDARTLRIFAVCICIHAVKLSKIVRDSEYNNIKSGHRNTGWSLEYWTTIKQK